MKLKFLPFIAVALIALAFAGCGSDDESDSASSSTGGNGTDRAFVKEMVPHHQSAIDMAEIAQKRLGKDRAGRVARADEEDVETLGHGSFLGERR